jgi:hypothetical protein
MSKTRTSFGLGKSRVRHNDGDDTRRLGNGFQVHQSDASHTDDTDLDDILGVDLFHRHAQLADGTRHGLRAKGGGARHEQHSEKGSKRLHGDRASARTENLIERWRRGGGKSSTEKEEHLRRQLLAVETKAKDVLPHLRESQSISSCSMLPVSFSLLR